MIRSSAFRSFGALLSAFVISSCSDSVFQSPTAPELPSSQAAQAAQAASASILGLGKIAEPLPDLNKLQLKALWWKKKPLMTALRVSKTIDASGGTISMPAMGLTMVFPAGAVSAPLTITVTSDDKYVAYKMEPSGTKFLKDVTVTQLLSLTQLTGVALRQQLYAAYIGDDRAKLTGKIPVLELEPSSTTLSPTSGLAVAQVWVIKHFSRYMLASG